jgi:hypothetical protein
MCDYPLYEKTFTSRRALKRKKDVMARNEAISTLANHEAKSFLRSLSTRLFICQPIV